MWSTNDSGGRRIVIATGAWCVFVGAGLMGLLHYETRPGAAGRVQDDWPSASGIHRHPGHNQLLMFVHPRCPCSRASLEELAHVMTDCQGMVTARVLFFRPPNAGADWGETALYKQASKIPGVEVVADEGGRERAAFGVSTSGHTLLYSDTGKLIFSGGITVSRGHSGDNAGRSAIVRFLSTGTSEKADTFVFGCPLHKK